MESLFQSALFLKFLGNAPADAAGTAGDDDDLIVKHGNAPFAFFSMIPLSG